MKFIDLLQIFYHDKMVGTLSLSPDNKLSVFEYNPDWIVSGFSISPLELPLKKGIFIAKPFPFYGNFGIFEDSLPDGYGRYLLHKALLRDGIDDSKLSVLQHLSIVGENGMGALTYRPVTSIITSEEIADLDLLQRKALEVLREQQDEDASLLLYNSGNSGGARPKVIIKDDTGHWLVKFRHTYDPHDIGCQEFHYNEIARKCGINVPDFKLLNDKFFASRRFDISKTGMRIHVATAGGLLGIDRSTPVMDYNNLLALTGWLTQNETEVEEMYRRMIFNYLTDNKDDHCKNFSFYVDDSGSDSKWKLAPAYDLTLCSEGYNGEHATSVNGTGHPSLKDFIKTGMKIKLKETRCKEIIDEVYHNCGDLLRYSL